MSETRGDPGSPCAAGRETVAEPPAGPTTAPTWTFDAELWWDRDGPEASWVFLTVPEEVAGEIRELSGPRRGFGSVRVEVTLGPSTWRTSVFPGGRGYVLPVKKAVRRAAGIEAGDTAAVGLRLSD